MTHKPQAGRLKFALVNFDGNEPKDQYFGDETVSRRALFNIKRMIQNGKINDIDLLEKMLRRTFNMKLRVQSDSIWPVLIAEPLSITQTNRRELTRMMFETFNVPKYASIPQPILALHAMGKRSGIVIDSGYESTRIVPVHQGQIIRDAVCTLNVGGAHLTDYMVHIMAESNLTFSTTAEKQIVTFSMNLRESNLFVTL